MEDEKKGKWLNYLSLTTVLVAVFATLSTFKGGGYSTKSLLSQSKASDQWAYYQSKSIKSYLYEMQKENLELQLNSTSNKANLEELQKRIDFYKGKIKKYEEEKEQITKEAKNFETIRDESKNHSEKFGIAVIFLQVSILLSSISALTKKKFLWIVSIITGIIGIIYFINGFVVFF
jgi:hypothetical protein